MKKPIVNKELCSGCGTCVALCPDAFELDEDGKSRVIEQSDYIDLPIQECIDSCPQQAISWSE
ncbi:MAG: ferredoxin [Patescibacteria group bacterium]|jgi:ferredoxin